MHLGTGGIFGIRSGIHSRLLGSMPRGMAPDRFVHVTSHSDDGFRDAVSVSNDMIKSHISPEDVTMFVQARVDAQFDESSLTAAVEGVATGKGP